MSSDYVRTQFKTFLTTNAAGENQIDLTAKFDSVRQIIADAGLNHTDNWLGLQFIGSSEEPQSLASTNTGGHYREIGSLFLHVVEPVGSTVAADILARTETLRSLFRGQRINDILIESVSPPNFESGATLQFEGGYQSASIIVNYQRDLKF